MPSKKTLSIVVSAHNEESGIFPLQTELKTQLKKTGYTYEIIFVDDGSTDKTLFQIKKLARASKKIKAIKLATNFGHEAAMLAGIDYAKGSVIICMDADLQHPPKKIPEMLRLFEKGAQIVTMVRTDAQNWGAKNILSKLFYKIMNFISEKKIEPGATDFFLISKTVAKVLKSDYREKTRFIRGIIQIMGYKNATLSFNAPLRKTGESKYSFQKLFALSLVAFSSFSRAPLHFCFFIGVIMSAISFLLVIHSIIFKLLGLALPGYTTIVVFTSIMFSVQFLILGIISEYLGFLLIEHKNRPIYTIENKFNV
jgi:glycosyltransferase involved in cell wall biosynthesis